ncbi:MAG TPA: rhomboid family intramembrane serine protease [Flavobacterium sp.]|nr:rhomboid family intramembrane serine protease [Flavobacterium sp.]
MRNRLNIQKIPVVNKLMIVVAAISVLVMLMRFFDVSAYRWILQQFALFSDLNILGFRIWQFLTYSFIHADIWHLAINLLMLYFFSTLFFTFFNEKQFLKVYFLGAVAAGIFYILGSYLIGQHHYVVGASGAVMAVFFTVVGYNPKISVHLIIFGRVALWMIALVLVAFDVVQLFSDNTGGHLAHLGGSLFGFLYGNYLKGFSFDFLPKIRKKQKTSLRAVHNDARQKKRQIQEDNVQKRIDVILDKISKSGYDSLTQEEKEFLFKQK